MKLKKSDCVCNEEIFQSLFKKYAKDLHDFLYYKFGAECNPKDIVQEAFLKLWDNCKNVQEDKAKSYLFTVANNLTLNVISKQKTILRYENEGHSSNAPETPQFLLEEREYMDQLQDALNSLTEEQRVTFMLNRVEGKKHKEIAELLGVSRKAVEKRIYTALAILKSKVEGIR